MANNIINLDRKRNRHSRADSARWEKMDRCVLCWHLTNVPQNTPLSQRKILCPRTGTALREMLLRALQARCVLWRGQCELITMTERKTDQRLTCGQRFGRWTVLGGCMTTPRGERKYLCRCDCGTERYVLERSLLYGGSQSCGCLRKEMAYQANAYNLLGQTFGELHVVGKSRKRTKMGSYWTCLCSCGYTCEATASELVSGRKTHCGCKSVKNNATSDITGQRFGRLIAQYSTKKRDAKGFVIWHCRCDCGNEADISYNSLVYCNQISCGCKKKEHDKALGGFLTHVDGTSIDALKSSKLPSNNTTGVKGVYLVKGRYLAKIVFQRRQYFLGTYPSVEEAAEARKKAEEAIHGEVISFYEKWSEKAAADPVWAKDNPIKISVSKSADAELRVQLQPDL